MSLSDIARQLLLPLQDVATGTLHGAVQGDRSATLPTGFEHPLHKHDGGVDRVDDLDVAPKQAAGYGGDSPEEIARIMHRWRSIAGSWLDLTDPVDVVDSAATFFSKVTKARAARAAPYWERSRGHCMCCDAPIRSVAQLILNENPGTAESEHHCRACGWAVCTRCSPPGQTLPLEYWVSSTVEHPKRRADQSCAFWRWDRQATKQKRVCRFCLIDQPYDKSRSEGGPVPWCPGTLVPWYPGTLKRASGEQRLADYLIRQLRERGVVQNRKTLLNPKDTLLREIQEIRTLVPEVQRALRRCQEPGFVPIYIC